ncbi:MAG: hypothetical protein FWF41_05475 [Betaproteobacteria bacterium]|nr:hypothetical protein [Betaproteobacteria bacterium]
MVDFPESLKPIAEVIGESATLSLVAVYGGTRLYFPQFEAIDALHPVARVIGLPLAQELCRALGGETFDIPRCAKNSAAERDAEILRRRKNGESVASIALSLGMTESAIWKRWQVMRGART